jgi:CRP-like cAMP-binding protein
MLVEGFLCRYKNLPDGKRQIMAFYVPGDIPDLLSLHIEVMDHSLATIVPSRVAFIPHAALARLIEQNPRIACAFRRDTLVDAALFREWIVNLGSRDAYSRIAHLICEVYLKLKAVELTNGNSFDFPVTQSEIGDATGLSTVHVNRSVMELRKDGLIILEKGRCTIRDLGRLEQAAMFDPTYLHLSEEQSAGGGLPQPNERRCALMELAPSQATSRDSFRLRWAYSWLTELEEPSGGSMIGAGAIALDQARDQHRGRWDEWQFRADKSGTGPSPTASFARSASRLCPSPGIAIAFREFSA